MQSNSSDNCVHRYNIEIFSLFDAELQFINARPMIKLKEVLSELKKFQFQTILVLKCKKRNDRKIFHSRTKLIVSDSDIDEECKSMHQNMTRIKNFACQDWIVI